MIFFREVKFLGINYMKTPIFFPGIIFVKNINPGLLEKMKLLFPFFTRSDGNIHILVLKTGKLNNV